MEPLCQQQRKYLGISCTDDELNEIELIQNRISCAQQAARPDAIPKGISSENAEAFIRAALESLAQARWLEDRWWKQVRVKYQLPHDVNVWIDFMTKEFYVIE